MSKIEEKGNSLTPAYPKLRFPMWLNIKYHIKGRLKEPLMPLPK